MPAIVLSMVLIRQGVADGVRLSSDSVTIGIFIPDLDAILAGLGFWSCLAHG